MDANTLEEEPNTQQAVGSCKHHAVRTRRVGTMNGTTTSNYARLSPIAFSSSGKRTLLVKLWHHPRADRVRRLSSEAEINPRRNGNGEYCTTYWFRVNTRGLNFTFFVVALLSNRFFSVYFRSLDLWNRTPTTLHAFRILVCLYFAEGLNFS